MTHRMKMSWIMKKGHSIASSIKGECSTYKAALSKGLKKAWAIVGGLLPNVDGEKVSVINADIQQNWAQSCLGNLEVEVCEFEVIA